MTSDSSEGGGGARTDEAERIRTARQEGPGLLSRLPGMAYQCRHDPDWTMEFVSDGCRSLTGHEPEELVGSEGVTYGELIHPDDRALVWNEVQRALAARDPHYELRYRIVRADGETREVWEQGHPVHSEDGELLGLEGFITDVTELARTRRRLSASEQMVRSLVHQALVGVYVMRDGRFGYVNPALAATFGYTAEEIRDRLGPLDLVDERDRPVVRDAVRRRMEGEEESVRYEFTGRRKDGEPVSVEVHGSLVELGGERAIAGVLIDVTERRALEEQLRHAQRVEGLGELTSAIAHDFNNYLTAIIAPVELVLQDLDEDHPSRVELLQVRETAKRAATLTGQLLSFGRRRIYSPRPVRVNSLLDNLRLMLDRLTGERVEMTYDLAPDLPAVMADPSHLQQVVVNLVVNARDAMPEGGRIAIATRLETVGKGGGSAAARVVLTVEDSGHGIDEATRLRIFDPYFTTKEAGTGLGLSTVFGIVKQHGGDVRVESDPGEGARFTVLLPASDAVPSDSELPPSASSDAPPAVRSGAILVVEDEDAVRRVVVTALRRFGYAVLEAADGAGAEEVEQAHEGAVHLLLTDLGLPDTTGPELAHRIRTRRSDLPVLLMSGYAPQELLEHEDGGGPFTFLEKPFMIEDLLKAVDGALGGRREGARRWESAG